MRERFWAPALIATGMILPSLLFAPPAKADPVSNYTAIAAPAVCGTLDAYPTVAGVTGVLEGVVQDSGFGYYDAGLVVAAAVINECPRHLPLLQRFIAVYGKGRTV
jgi:hypothetical protein